MLDMHNKDDFSKMFNYYRTSDMLNLLLFFPKLSPIKDLVIVENKEDFLNNKDFLRQFSQNRVDTLKGRTPISGIENTGKSNTFYETLLKVKEKDSKGVLVLFNLSTKTSNRYERYAGISVGVNLGEDIIIDAVSKGFDGREVSKGICTHERYVIPWYDLRKLTINNFKNYQTYQINASDYQKSREERITFLKSIGLTTLKFDNFIPKEYEPIPYFIWLSLIRNLLKELLKNEEILKKSNFTHFAISGHTEEKEFAPWQMFDKNRYTKQG